MQVGTNPNYGFKNKKMESVYTFTRPGENDIHVVLEKSDNLLYNLIHHASFDLARKFSPGTYNGGNIELTEKDIELMLSISYHTEKKKLEQQMKEISRRLETRREEYNKERQDRNIPMGNDRIRKQIQILKKEIEEKEMELNLNIVMPKLIKFNF
jgi:hypothetical protein